MTRALAQGDQQVGIFVLGRNQTLVPTAEQPDKEAVIRLALPGYLDDEPYCCHQTCMMIHCRHI